jgi:hypothetical protein
MRRQHRKSYAEQIGAGEVTGQLRFSSFIIARSYRAIRRGRGSLIASSMEQGVGPSWEMAEATSCKLEQRQLWITAGCHGLPRGSQVWRRGYAE